MLKKFTAVFIFVLMAFSLSLPANAMTAASAPGEIQNGKNNLEWMRSSELKEDSLILDVSTNSNSWSYENAFNNTPLKYFTTSGAQALANSKAALGQENVSPAQQQVGYDSVWDNGTYFEKYKNENGNATYDWASWKHHGVSGNTVNKGEYSIRRFSSYINISSDELAALESAVLAPEDELGNMSYLFPINDTVLVFVNGQLAYWGGTDIIEGQNQYNALNRAELMGQAGIKVRSGVNGIFKSIYPHTDGWCIDLSENEAAVDVKPLLSTGFNRIDVFADDYWEGGGMNKLNLFVQSSYIPEEPELIITKAQSCEDEMEIGTGEFIEYYITVKNISNVDVYDATVFDDVPDDSVYAGGAENSGGVYDSDLNRVTWDLPLVAANSEITLSFKVAYDIDGRVSISPPILYDNAAGEFCKYDTEAEARAAFPGYFYDYPLLVSPQFGNVPYFFIMLFDEIPDGYDVGTIILAGDSMPQEFYIENTATLIYNGITKISNEVSVYAYYAGGKY